MSNWRRVIKTLSLAKYSSHKNKGNLKSRDRRMLRTDVLVSSHTKPVFTAPTKSATILSYLPVKTWVERSNVEYIC